MSLEPGKVPEENSEAGLGSLRGCLVEGNAEQQRGERRVRRRALILSVALQSAALTLLVLVPLFGKTERIAVKNFVPIPPYGHPSGRPRGNSRSTISRPAPVYSQYIFQRPTNRPAVQSAGEQSSSDSPDFGPTTGQPQDGPSCGWCVDLGSKNDGPRPPQPATETHARPQILRMTSLDPAMLIHRVEPEYPALARQIHKEGRVELRAIIGTDGTIQSLQIVNGDPLFDLSAKQAVAQWRYRPTILNGQPVEIDTYITVVYTMQH
jgi:periplasmic protein TonB